MQSNINDEIQNYETLDKDYGRTLMVGPGYGECDLDQYEMLVKLAG